MIKRLLLVAVCILALPIWFSPSRGRNPNGSLPFATVALAGHTLAGVWCECGTPDCICDPGESPERLVTSSPTGQTGGFSDQSVAPESTEPDSGSDYGPGVLLLALVFMVWARFRA